LDDDNGDSRQRDNLQGQLKRSVIIVPQSSLQFVTLLPPIFIVPKIRVQAASTCISLHTSVSQAPVSGNCYRSGKLLLQKVILIAGKMFPGIKK
jgi:hypothetical protein